MPTESQLREVAEGIIAKWSTCSGYGLIAKEYLRKERQLAAARHAIEVLLRRQCDYPWDAVPASAVDEWIEAAKGQQ